MAAKNENDAQTRTTRKREEWKREKVKATPAEQQELLRLQDADTRLQQVQHVEKNLPQLAQLAALETNMTDVRARLLEREGELEDARAEQARIESDVAVVQARVTRDSARVEHTASVKDVQALETELSALRKRTSDLEDIELVVMERIEQLEKAAHDVEAERDTLVAEIGELDQQRSEEQARLETQKESIAADRSSIVGEISAELVSLYERQRERYGIGAALLRGRVSLGSNVTLTGSDLELVRKAAPDDVVLDPESGCILVRTEESGL